MEIQEILGDDNHPASNSELQNMKYTELVLKEGMRMYTPAPFVARTLHEDMNFSEYDLLN